MCLADETGVLAGRRRRNARRMSCMVPPSSRQVIVMTEETCLAGAAAHVTVPGGHSFIMMREDVKELVPRFLGSGVMPAGVGRVTCGGVVDISRYR